MFVCLALLALGFTALGAMVGRRLPPLSASVESGVGELGRNFYPRFERELALTPEQTAQLRPLFDRARADAQLVASNALREAGAIRGRLRREVRPLLSAGQREHWRQLDRPKGRRALRWLEDETNPPAQP